MTLDGSDVVSSHLCRKCSEGKPSCGPMDVDTTTFCGPLLFASRSRSSNRFFSRSFTRKPDRNRCASRVQGLSNAVFSPSAALLPSAPTLAQAEWGDRESQPSPHQEGKRRSESCAMKILE